MSSTFVKILKAADIDHFREQVNDLHDAYLVHSSFSHHGHSFGNPHWIDPKKSELRLCYAVTSLPGIPVVELVFEGVLEWHMVSDPNGDILSTHLDIEKEGTVFWGDDDSAALPECRNDCSWVSAQAMKWRICERLADK